MPVLRLGHMDRYSAITLIGIIMVGSGLYFVYPPLALIVPGGVLALLGLVAGRGRGREEER